MHIDMYICVCMHVCVKKSKPCPNQDVTMSFYLYSFRQYLIKIVTTYS